jgi:phage virion morphogenesis protein
MAGTDLTITHNIPMVVKQLGAIAARFGSPRPGLDIIGETVVASVEQNFQEGGRPTRWAGLKPATWAAKGSRKTLVESGRLRGSITKQIAGSTVVVGTNVEYGAIHQFGGKAGRGRRVTIPARPFLLVQDEDWEEINEAMSEFLWEGKK